MGDKAVMSAPITLEQQATAFAHVCYLVTVVRVQMPLSSLSDREPLQ